MAKKRKKSLGSTKTVIPQVRRAARAAPAGPPPRKRGGGGGGGGPVVMFNRRGELVIADAAIRRRLYDGQKELIIRLGSDPDPAATAPAQLHVRLPRPSG
jgi:hypothetical protein